MIFPPSPLSPSPNIAHKTIPRDISAAAARMTQDPVVQGGIILYQPAIPRDMKGPDRTHCLCRYILLKKVPRNRAYFITCKKITQTFFAIHCPES